MSRGIALPSRSELGPLFGRLGISDDDASEIRAAWPSPSGDPEMLRALKDAHATLVADMGGFLPITLPGPPADSRFFYVFVLLAALADVRRYHRERGVPDDVAWSTLADLGRNLARDRILFGIGGLKTSGWLTLHFRGAIYELGRLQFNRMRLRAVHAGAGEEGEPALGVHIPEAGPLTPASCEESFALARPFFSRHFPEDDVRIGVCTSWLLDPQLADYIDPDSNVMRFQRRFQLIGEGYEGDADILRFVFHRIAPDLDELPQRTTLERAIVTHLRAGGHWRNRTGWLSLSG